MVSQAAPRRPASVYFQCVSVACAGTLRAPETVLANRARSRGIPENGRGIPRNPAESPRNPLKTGAESPRNPLASRSRATLAPPRNPLVSPRKWPRNPPESSRNPLKTGADCLLSRHSSSQPWPLARGPAGRRTPCQTQHGRGNATCSNVLILASAGLNTHCTVAYAPEYVLLLRLVRRGIARPR